MKNFNINFSDQQTSELLELVRQRITFCFRWASYHEHHGMAVKQDEWLEEAARWQLVENEIERVILEHED